MLLENICVKHTPETSIFGHLKVTADQLTKERARAEQLTCLRVKTIYHIWNKMDI